MLKTYERRVNGAVYQFQMTEADAKRVGAVLVEETPKPAVKQRRVANKARTAVDKASE